MRVQSLEGGGHSGAPAVWTGEHSRWSGLPVRC